jgi:hypothetical protein
MAPDKVHSIVCELNKTDKRVEQEKLSLSLSNVIMILLNKRESKESRMTRKDSVYATERGVELKEKAIAEEEREKGSSQQVSGSPKDIEAGSDASEVRSDRVSDRNEVYKQT